MIILERPRTCQISLPHAVWRASRTATPRRAATRARRVTSSRRSSTRSRPRAAQCTNQITLGRAEISLVDVAHRYGYLSPELWKPTARAGVVIYFMDAESRRESKILLTRRSLLRSSARRPSKNTPTSSPRRPNRPRPTPRIRRVTIPPSSRWAAVPRTSGAHDPRGVSRTGLARKWSNNPNKTPGIR